MTARPAGGRRGRSGHRGACRKRDRRCGSRRRRIRDHRRCTRGGKGRSSRRWFEAGGWGCEAAPVGDEEGEGEAGGEGHGGVVGAVTEGIDEEAADNAADKGAELEGKREGGHSSAPALGAGTVDSHCLDGRRAERAAGGRHHHADHEGDEAGSLAKEEHAGRRSYVTDGDRRRATYAVGEACKQRLSGDAEDAADKEELRDGAFADAEVFGVENDDD